MDTPRTLPSDALSPKSEANPTWPNLFVVGAAKAGTTSLHRYLSASPDVFMSVTKEPHFFSSVDARGTWTIVKDQDQYLSLFSARESEIYAGESSPSYLWDPGAAERIHRASPDARILMLLRDPVRRAHSHYLMDVREGLVEGDFLQAVRRDYERQDKGWGTSHLYVELGLYADAITRYQDLFGAESVLVLVFEEFIKDPGTSLTSVARFLGLPDDAFSAAETATAHNPYRQARSQLVRRLLNNKVLAALRKRLPRGMRRAGRQALLREGAPPELEPAAWDYLRPLFQADMQRVEAILERPLPWGAPG